MSTPPAPMLTAPVAGGSAERAYTALVSARALLGVGAWIAPRRSAGALGVRLPARVPQLYTDRLFGTRELLLAVQQAAATGEERERLRRAGIAVDLLDAAWAVVAGVRGHLPRRAALFWTLTGLTAAGLGARAGRGV